MMTTEVIFEIKLESQPTDCIRISDKFSFLSRLLDSERFATSTSYQRS